MRVPTIHMNGSNPETLLEGLTEAYRAVDTAMRALDEAAPNGRDYYIQGPDAVQEATSEHRRRAEKLRSVQAELEELVVSVQDQIDVIEEQRARRRNPGDVRVRFDGYARSELDIQKEVEDVIGDDSFAVVLPYYADGVLTCPRGVKEDVADALNDLSNAYEEQSRLSTKYEREHGESRAVLDAISKGFGTASRRLRGAP